VYSAKQDGEEAVSVKVYQLFGSPGGFSNDTSNYAGTSYYVAAENNRQAHHLANGGIWATNAERPLGIVDVYQGAGALWDGIDCGVGASSTAVSASSTCRGVRALWAAMRKHVSDHHVAAPEGVPVRDDGRQAVRVASSGSVFPPR
jgi:hypothetical protein